jgi:hypothetical protein
MLLHQEHEKSFAPTESGRAASKPLVELDFCVQFSDILSEPGRKAFHKANHLYAHGADLVDQSCEWQEHFPVCYSLYRTIGCALPKLAEESTK